jgi:hypothetical protein
VRAAGGSRAGRVVEIVPGLFHDTIFDPHWDVSEDAWVIDDGVRQVLVDPLPGFLDRLGPPARTEAIIIATPGHQRSAWECRARTGAPVHAPAGPAPLEELPDLRFSDGDRLPGGLVAIETPGPGERHFVLYRAEGAGAVYCPDLVVNDPIRGLRFVADAFQADPVRTRLSALRLLDLKFECLCFGHGAPILRGGRQALEDLLRRERLRPGR